MDVRVHNTVGTRRQSFSRVSASRGVQQDSSIPSISHVCTRSVQYPQTFPRCPPPPQGGTVSISALVQQLAERDTAYDAVSAIASMADVTAGNYPATHAKIIAAGAIPPLVALMGAQSTEWVVMLVAGALQNLSTNNAGNTTKIINAGAISPLVALLSALRPAAVQEKAAGALQNLACNNASNQLIIVAAGAIPPLVALLGGRQSTAAARVQAVGALQNLSSNNNADREAEIIAAGAIPPCWRCWALKARRRSKWLQQTFLGTLPSTTTMWIQL